MKWLKRGIVFNPAGKLSWAVHTALQPTPIILEDKIRVYAGFRDDEGMSRIGWVDLDSGNPAIVLDYSKKPVLNTGLPGAFDDNGVVPSSVVKRDNQIYLYYAGYQLVKNVRFIAFTGLAISRDNGNSFERVSNVPVFERTSEEFLFRAIHSIMYKDGTWKVWYGGGNHFIQGENKTLPVYNIRYLESEDGIHFPQNGKVVLDNNKNEYRVGRPCVIYRNSKYFMFFGASGKSQQYRLSCAESDDGIFWTRKDETFGLEYKENDFDSEMSAYPGIIEANNKIYMFYNGNNYGRDGFGLAELLEK